MKLWKWEITKETIARFFTETVSKISAETLGWLAAVVIHCATIPTLLAMLNSLHMGFRTLALEKQASEVWKVLGAVKTEFERYGEWVEKVRDQVHKAANTLDLAQSRSRQMKRALNQVEALPVDEAKALLPPIEEGDKT